MTCRHVENTFLQKPCCERPVSFLGASVSCGSGCGHTERRRGNPCHQTQWPVTRLLHSLDGSQTFSVYSHTLDAARAIPSDGTGYPVPWMDPKAIQQHGLL